MPTSRGRARAGRRTRPAIRQATSITVGYVGNSWNDVISSSRGYNNCQLKHWEHANWEGRSTGWLSSASYLGDAMNDETSSLQFA
jgi:hypothetical protein